MFKVAIRSPGEKRWTRKTEILEFRTFYGVLQETQQLLWWAVGGRRAESVSVGSPIEGYAKLSLKK